MDVLDWTIVHTAVHRIGVAATARCCLIVSFGSFSFSSRFLHLPANEYAFNYPINAFVCVGCAYPSVAYMLSFFSVCM